MPAQSPYSNMLNTALPFLYPLLVGFVAAVTEEFMFRLFAISFLKKFLKLTWVALLIPAVIWAFGHSSYQVFPVYVRGIEITIAGLVFGYFFIRFDLMSCIVAHYAIDALFVGLPLIRSPNRYFQVSGLIVFLLGLIPVLPVIIRGKREVPA